MPQPLPDAAGEVSFIKWSSSSSPLLAKRCSHCWLSRALFRFPNSCSLNTSCRHETKTTTLLTSTANISPSSTSAPAALPPLPFTWETRNGDYDSEMFSNVVVPHDIGSRSNSNGSSSKFMFSFSRARLSTRAAELGTQWITQLGRISTIRTAVL